MKNLDVLNIVKQRIEYNRQLEEETKKEILEILEEVEADILDIMDGAELNEVFHKEHGGLEESAEVLPLSQLLATEDREDSYDENFKPKTADEHRLWYEYGLNQTSDFNL